MTYGGRRPNAGRKLGSGRYGEPTKALRVPISRIDEILALIKPEAEKTDEEKAHAARQKEAGMYNRPYYANDPRFPLAWGEMGAPETVNLNAVLLPKPDPMLIVRVPDDGMVRCSIWTGDLVLVDSSKRMLNGHIVAAIVNGAVVIRRLRERGKKLHLAAGNSRYPATPVDTLKGVRLLGVVTAVIHQL